MATLTWETATEQLQKALDDGVRIAGQQSEHLYWVSSRSQPAVRQVWVQGRIANCSCELSTRGHKPCPHGALAFFRACWDRATEGAR